jgi:hypothetical protein
VRANRQRAARGEKDGVTEQINADHGLADAWTANTGGAQRRRWLDRRDKATPSAVP